MTKTEALIRSILGPVRKDIRSLALAVDHMAHLLFVEKVPMDDIKVSTHIYPDIEAQLKRRHKTVSKSVERLAKDCWETGEPDYLAQIIGKRLRYAPTPREMIIYLAFYSHLDMPFFIAVGHDSAFLF